MFYEHYMMILNLAENPENLQDAWDCWVSNSITYPPLYAHGLVRRYHNEWRWVNMAMFLDMVTVVTDGDVSFCGDCQTPHYPDDMTGDYCESCYYENYTSCDGCASVTPWDDVQSVDDCNYCESCYQNRFEYCPTCGASFPIGTHSHNCDCEAPHLSFTVPLGDGFVSEDERFTVALPKGTIDESTISWITSMIYDALTTEHHNINPFYIDVYNVMNQVGNEWQTKRGNFTKRLSSAIYKKWNIKLSSEMISSIGNIARSRSDSDKEFFVEFTRDLNQPAYMCVNEGSCWWSEYSESRCALKNWGGFALRTYESEFSLTNNPIGRAWVQPLNADLDPTHDSRNAHAYVIYNIYGSLSGFTAARIIAQMTGKTYRHLNGFTAQNQYVNGNSGYLVMDECDNDVEQVHLRGYIHDTKEVAA